jgi:hypothetical protein
MQKGLSFDVLRTGKKYRLINFGDVYQFCVIDILGKENFELKDLHTLENYFMEDIIRYGKGDDFEIREIE